MKPADIITNVPTPSCAQKPLAVATPDGGLLYTGFKCLNYIPALSAGGQDAAEIKTMSTRITINELDVSPLWGKKHGTEQSMNHGKQCAIVAEDWSVQVWDCELGVAVSSHKAHQHQNEARDLRMYPQLNVLMSYMTNGNILSIDAGNLVIYCVASNSYFRRPSFLPLRNQNLTALRCSPYNEHLFAVGTSTGSILICDLSEMAVVHKLNSRGRSSSICGLAWREMSPRHEDTHADNNTEQWRSTAAAAPKAPLQKAKAEECDDMFDIYNYDHLESEFGAPASVRPRRSVDDCDDFVGLEKPSSNVTIDFIEACESMKAELAAHHGEPSDKPQVEVTLQDCQETGTCGPRSDSSCNEDSLKEQQSASEGSLEVIQFSSSSDDAVIVDGEASKPKREVLHHIYHQAEVHDAPESPQMQQQKNKDPPLAKPKAQLTKEASVDTLSHESNEASARPDIVLASINDSDVIMLWNTVTGEHCAKNYSKINGTVKGKQVHWLNDHTIVSMSRHQLYFWAIAYDGKTRRYKISKDQLHKCSEQDIVACVASAAYPQIWLNTRNRRVLLLNPLNGQVSASYSCLAFGLRAMSECPNDMNKIALGCSDKRVALFDISKLSASCIPVESVFVNSPVYSLSWSPDCRHLAYGTFDGVVGILDVDRMRVTTTFRPLFKKEIYSLMWSKTDLIYFIVNGTLGYYTPRQPNIEAVVFNHVERASYLYVLDKHVLVGTQFGILELYSHHRLREGGSCVFRQALTNNYVTDIAFNPVKENVFAVSGNSHVLHVVELRAETEDWCKLHKFVDYDEYDSIASLKWSNRHAHLLLSFHIEGKVCMWSTKEPEQPPLIIRYQCPMWCGLFLPSDENIIVCGGKTLSLELVSIKEALASNEKQIRSKMDPLTKLRPAFKSSTQPSVPALSAAQKKRQRREKRQANLHASAHGNPQTVGVVAVPAVEGQPEQAKPPSIESMLGGLSLDTKTSVVVECQKCKQLESQTKPNTFLSPSRTCLCLTQKELNKSALEKLAIVLTEDAAKIDKSVLLSKLFSTKVVAKDLIATELSNLKQSNNKDIAPLNLAVTTFKLREELEQHIANKTLTEWHLSLAPAVSYVFWQMCCKAYAQQMEDQGFVLHAATYMLAVDMQSEAINMLLKHEYFKEALINARVHLPATDPIINTIINKWLDQLEKTGNFAAAALICVLDNEMLRGYLYLRKFRNCTPEIADLMEQIKRIGQLGYLFDDGCPDATTATVIKAVEEAG